MKTGFKPIFGRDIACTAHSKLKILLKTSETGLSLILEHDTASPDSKLEIVVKI